MGLTTIGISVRRAAVACVVLHAACCVCYGHADANMLDSVIGLDVGGDRQGGAGAARVLAG